MSWSSPSLARNSWLATFIAVFGLGSLAWAGTSTVVVTAPSGETLSSCAPDDDGAFWATDGNDRVFTQGPADTAPSLFVEGMAKDTDAIRVAPDGTVVVSGQPVTGWDTDGTALWSVDCGNSNPQGLTIDLDGTVYLSNGSSICVVDPTAGTASFLGSFSTTVQALVWNADSGLLTASFGIKSDPTTWLLASVDPSSGAIVDTISTTWFTTLGMDFDREGRLILVDKNSNTLVRIATDGSSETLATGFTTVNDVQVGSDGAVYVTDTGAGEVIRLYLDEDEDEVEDVFDECPDTDPGAIVGEDGCSGEQEIDLACGGPEVWPNHGAYVSCVTHAAREAYRDGLLTNKEAAALIRTAAHVH